MGYLVVVWVRNGVLFMDVFLVEGEGEGLGCGESELVVVLNWKWFEFLDFYFGEVLGYLV